MGFNSPLEAVSFIWRERLGNGSVSQSWLQDCCGDYVQSVHHGYKIAVEIMYGQSVHHGYKIAVGITYGQSVHHGYKIAVGIMYSQSVRHGYKSALGIVYSQNYVTSWLQECFGDRL